MTASPPAVECGLPDWISQSGIMKQWEKIRREVDLLKWLESEKVGYDIGWERAWTQWLIQTENVGASDGTVGNKE